MKQGTHEVKTYLSQLLRILFEYDNIMGWYIYKWYSSFHPYIIYTIVPNKLYEVQ